MSSIKESIGNLSSNLINAVMGSGIFSPVLVQFGPKSAHTMEDVDYNTNRIIEYMERACTGFPGIDMIVFPECCFQGMAPNDWVKVALEWDSEPIRRVQAKCKELQIWGCFDPWIINRKRGGIENTCIIINDEGEIVHRYVKMNPWFPYEPTLPGREMPVCKGPKGARIATLICADAHYQEVWREAVANGANVILHVSHWMGPFGNMQKMSNRAGAFFNNVMVLACNSVGMDECYNYPGGSMVVNDFGEVLQELPDGVEGMIYYPFGPLMEDVQHSMVPMNALLWEAEHRGAMTPNAGEIGYGYEDYTVYNKDKKSKK